ncbi:glucosamine-6-phosphate deaminase [Sporosarcina sp. G11-34]|uniref:glucosamine-6-phosphate deaminase n=1 Tax=Sporosarcina sp. G11-34 TaxID=2849605 RepID=UPI0022A988E5|nr:glucosamine-6-phosphate deaminase [Sporosarcina sp. G11-34]MCZ2258533.1 glucosamine-6-phosphate deaminase [Sporosarcina sp. G11-34]
MKVIVLADYEAVSKEAARLVEEKVSENDQLVLGLATGSTPLGLYENLIDGYKTRGISYQNVKTINLDEYLGLEKDHPESYHTFMVEKLFKHIDIARENTFIPDGQPSSIEAECARYEKVMNRVGPINLQILGIGSNGHIGFNEPGTDPESETHVVELNDSTRKDNAQFFNSIEEVPTHAITLGIQNILKSDKIILLASGKKKAEAIKILLEKNVSASFPASYLWNHPNVTVIVDEDAYQLVRQKQ